MNLFRRIKNIIDSNVNYGKNINEIDINSYDDIYYEETNPVSYSNNKEKEYYKILEIEEGADFKKINSAYKKLLKKYHPDLFINNPEKQKAAEKITKKINEAYTYFERQYL